MFIAYLRFLSAPKISIAGIFFIIYVEKCFVKIFNTATLTKKLPDYVRKLLF